MNKHITISLLYMNLQTCISNFQPHTSGHPSSLIATQLRKPRTIVISTIQSLSPFVFQSKALETTAPSPLPGPSISRSSNSKPHPPFQPRATGNQQQKVNMNPNAFLYALYTFFGALSIAFAIFAYWYTRLFRILEERRVRTEEGARSAEDMELQAVEERQGQELPGRAEGEGRGEGRGRGEREGRAERQARPELQGQHELQGRPRHELHDRPVIR
ncbi:MAG: hypothetical protein LQ338_003408 [Usnochroma carphineum]|nr:MAG: hypothetical protein LQ338_003408 [Usnochroma carphineum]